MTIEELKRKRMQQLSQQNSQEIQEQLQLQQQIQQLEIVIKQYLSNEAITRYSNLKVAHPEQAVKALATIAQGIEHGYIKEKLTDEQFKSILKQISPEKKEFKLLRK